MTIQPFFSNKIKLQFGIAIILFVGILSSCQQKYPSLSCEMVKEMMKNDQMYRTIHRKISAPYFYILDSLIRQKGYPGGMEDFVTLDSQLGDQLQEQANDLASKLPKQAKSVVDSIQGLQAKLDFENSQKLIQIIQKIGLSTLDTMPFDCGRQSLAIFVHTPNELKSDVKKIIDPALKAMDEAQYNSIMSHLNGEL